MQLISSSLKFLNRKKLLIIGSVVFVATLTGIYVVNTWYRISHIQINTFQKGNVVAGLPAIKNKNILFLSEQSIKEIILDTNPTIKKVEVTKKLPDIVVLSIEYYRAHAYLQSSDGVFLLGAEGRVLAKSSEQGNPRLPIITYYQNIPFSLYQAGDDLPSQDIKDSIYFLSKLQEMRLKVNSIDIAGFHMLGLYTDKEKYFFTSEKDRNVQVYNLEQAIKKLKADGQEYRSIDVRFDKPVTTL